MAEAKKTVLVTGAAGFLGAEICRQLRAQGVGVLTTDFAGAVDVRGDLADAGFARYVAGID